MTVQILRAVVQLGGERVLMLMPNEAHNQKCDPDRCMA